jgi:hypothetical protein
VSVLIRISRVITAIIGYILSDLILTQRHKHGFSGLVDLHNKIKGSVSTVSQERTMTTELKMALGTTLVIAICFSAFFVALF